MFKRPSAQDTSHRLPPLARSRSPSLLHRLHASRASPHPSSNTPTRRRRSPSAVPTRNVGPDSSTRGEKLSFNNPCRNRQNLSRPTYSTSENVSDHIKSPRRTRERSASVSPTEPGRSAPWILPRTEWFYHALLPEDSKGHYGQMRAKNSISGPAIVHEDSRGSWLIRGCSWMLQDGSQSDDPVQAGSNDGRRRDSFQEAGNSARDTGYNCSDCATVIRSGFFSMALDMSPRTKLCWRCVVDREFEREGRPLRGNAYPEWLKRFAIFVQGVNSKGTHDHDLDKRERDKSIALAAGRAAWRRCAPDAAKGESTTSTSLDGQPHRIFRSPTIEATIRPDTTTCAICADELPRDRFPTSRMTSRCAHEHHACSTCIRQWIETQLTEAGWDRIRCMDCNEQLQYSDVQRHATRTVFERYDQLATRAALGSQPDFVWCQNTACGSGQIHEGGGEDMPLFHCRACNSRYCLTHQVAWHEGETCAAFDRRMNNESPVEEGQPMDNATARLYANEQRESSRIPSPEPIRTPLARRRTAQEYHDALERAYGAPVYLASSLDSFAVERDRYEYFDMDDVGNLARPRQRATKDFPHHDGNDHRKSDLLRQTESDALHARDLQRQYEREESNHRTQYEREESFYRTYSDRRAQLPRQRSDDQQRRTRDQIERDAAAARALEQTFAREYQDRTWSIREAEQRVRIPDPSSRATLPFLQIFHKEKTRKQRDDAEQQREAYRRRKAEEQQGEQTVRQNSKPCPRCRFPIQKNGGCDRA